MNTLRLALAQINTTVGDIRGNVEKISSHIRKAEKKKADIILFPELAVTGYPPEDLLLKPRFIDDNISAVEKLAGGVSGITAVVGFVEKGKDKALYNAAAIISGGKIADVYRKVFLPNYGVFDEMRYFRPGNGAPVYSLGGVKFGINICEDIWHGDGPARTQSLSGAELILNINASPYEIGKPQTRMRILSERSSENSVVIAYLNAVGGQDELVFDGSSMVVSHEGELLARCRQFEEELAIVDLDLKAVRSSRKASGMKPLGIKPKKIPAAPEPRISEENIRRPVISKPLDPAAEVYRALLAGTRDYVLKNGFPGVVIGLSGGVDSALVAAIASDAVGKENTTVLFMPSEYTSEESREDALELARNLGIRFIELPIDPVRDAYEKTLAPCFAGMKKDTTEENLQARIRGNLLMAFSNKFGSLVLTTGNKSEMSVGYATLYGDMAGGFAVIKDVPKILVYNLCRWRNDQGSGPVIPKRILTKEPSAELKPDQRDTDSLPPYEMLDPILRAYVEDELAVDEIVASGCDRRCTERVIAMVDRSEYKRRQAPPGVKITSRAFGRDRRFPITNRYRSG